MALHLSEATEGVLRRAREVSARWKHHYLSCEHLVMACCLEDAACEQWLQGQGLTIDEFEEAVLELVPTGDDRPIWEGVPESPRYRRVMAKFAQAEAEDARAHRVEPLHVLHGVLSEGLGIPCRILKPSGQSRRSGRSGSGAAAGRASGSAGAVGRGDRASETSDKKSKTPFLDKYSRDIVDMVHQGKVDPIIGRNDEVRRVLQILARKTKSNPVLIGEAGVGKTAVAFGLARRIYEERVPDALKDKRILELALSSMVAGAKHRGEFEERLEGVVKETMADPTIILFIDEIHQLVGAGDSRGGMDASNILKPALARGELRVLGATTTDEFRKYIEKDPALERRFQPVLVGEPSEEEALEMLRGIQKRFETHHGVTFTDEALAAAVALSVRYLPDRNLPDKAIDLIDESAARMKTKSGVFSLDAQGRASLTVTKDVVAEVVADWTGIPVQRMSEQESTRLLQMEQELAGRVVGQDHAVTAVAQAIRVVRVGLVAPNRPAGVFLFMGPSGVGKTELAKGLAEFLFGDASEMVRLDMSEYHDKHSVSRLIGSPPGYVGHDEEGQLTRAVRTKPYCVVLLDEVEKAHPEIFDLFLQVFDDGRLTDSKGRTVNFTNTLIIMTSNLGARELLEANLPNQGYAGQLDDMPGQYQQALKSHFRPEFLNRVDELIAFRALERNDLYGIAEIHLGHLRANLHKSKGVYLEITPDAVELLLEYGYQPQFGARPLQRAISTHLSRPLAEEMLRNPLIEGETLTADREGDKLVFRRAPQSASVGEPLGSTGAIESPGDARFENYDDFQDFDDFEELDSRLGGSPTPAGTTSTQGSPSRALGATSAALPTDVSGGFSKGSGVGPGRQPPLGTAPGGIGPETTSSGPPPRFQRPTPPSSSSGSQGPGPAPPGGWAPPGGPMGGTDSPSPGTPFRPLRSPKPSPGSGPVGEGGRR